MDDEAYGIEATVIDLGLARMETTDNDDCETHWTPFEEEIFEGEGTVLSPYATHVGSQAHPGDYQFDVYRMMRAHNGDSWEEYRPFTNVMVSPSSTARTRGPSCSPRARTRASNHSGSITSS